MRQRATPRRLPVGAEVLSEGGVHFRVWAPNRRRVRVVLEGGEGFSSGATPQEISLSPEGGGYFSGVIEQAGDGTLYRFRMDDEPLYPDPASRFQPDGPLGPSQVVDPSLFQWTDQDWPGVMLEGQVVYEMHIGTFTSEGAYQAAMAHLPALVDVGVTLLELMPLADFAGKFGWGYDGVDLFAPTRLYGTPEDLRRFVDRAHSLGLGVLLDVVYNHLGAVGNFLKAIAPSYFSTRYTTDWGDAFNFDDKGSEPVRELIISNGGYWIDEFHLDGLRVDATQSIFDKSPEHVLSALTKQARRAAGKRSIVIIAENEPQEVKIIQSPEEGGYGMDGLWNDDFHHSAMVALTGRTEAYYADYTGTPQEFISALKWGYLYQGQYYAWQNKRRGTPTFGLKPAAFVNFIQNHDQIANSPRGERCKGLTSSGRYRAMTALLLLCPGTPMLFQGQEFCASSPFLYFADTEGEMSELVRKGRKEFLSQFKSLTSPDIQERFSDPADPLTFTRSKLDQSERERNTETVALHRDLLKLRREDALFCAQRSDWMHGAVLAQEAFLLRFFGEEEGDRLLMVNFGRDLPLSPAPEPLLAPPVGCRWEVLWSSEAACYGGNGTPPFGAEESWTIPGHAAFVFTSALMRNRGSTDRPN